MNIMPQLKPSRGRVANAYDAASWRFATILVRRPGGGWGRDSV